MFGMPVDWERGFFLRGWEKGVLPHPPKGPQLSLGLGDAVLGVNFEVEKSSAQSTENANKPLIRGDPVGPTPPLWGSNLKKKNPLGELLPLAYHNNEKNEGNERNTLQHATHPKILSTSDLHPPESITQRNGMRG